MNECIICLSKPALNKGAPRAGDGHHQAHASARKFPRLGLVRLVLWMSIHFHLLCFDTIPAAKERRRGSQAQGRGAGALTRSRANLA